MQLIQDRIKTLAKDHFLTIKDLEEKSGLKKDTVWNLLNGRTKVPKIDTLVAISKALNCSLEELVFGKKDQIRLSSKNSIDLFESSFMKVVSFLKEKTLETSTDEIFKSTIELYTYCVDSGLSEIDEKFASYLLKKNFPSCE